MAEISIEELHVIELNGFLNAIRCMLGISPKLLGAVLVWKNRRPLDQLVQEVIDGDIGVPALNVNSEQDFKYIEKLFKKYIYSKIKNIDEACLKQLDWNLVEYYGLVSTAEDENGDWNRLVGQKHRVLEYIDGAGNDSVVFFVEHKEFVVMTYLSEVNTE